MFVDAIKNFVTSRTEALGALYKTLAPFLLATSDFRLYELLKNDSRFLRITDANAPAFGRDSLASAIKVKRGAHTARVAFATPSGRALALCGWWWRMTGSNRRPPACKAGALPAELIPPGKPLRDGGSGWTRTNDPRLIKTVL